MRGYGVGSDRAAGHSSTAPPFAHALRLGPPAIGTDGRRDGPAVRWRRRAGRRGR